MLNWFLRIYFLSMRGTNLLHRYFFSILGVSKDNFSSSLVPNGTLKVPHGSLEIFLRRLDYECVGIITVNQRFQRDEKKIWLNM